MPSTVQEAFKQTLTGSGTAAGVVPVTSSAGYKVGAYAWLQGPLGVPAAQLCRVTDIPDATHVGLVFVPEGIKDTKWMTNSVKFPNYGRSDCSGYPINSVLSQPEQAVEE